MIRWLVFVNPDGKKDDRPILQYYDDSLGIWVEVPTKEIQIAKEATNADTKRA